jgi:polysaccharide export outer membrane protein
MKELHSMVRTNQRAGGGWLAGVVLMLLMLAGTSMAQFSGPAVDLSDPVNVPLVPTTDHAILYPDSREIQLGQGDLLGIHLFGIPDYAPSVRVALDGTIQLPLIGSVSVDGLSVHQAENLIAQRLKEAQMYRDPQVTIQLMESPNEIVTVTGELHGVVPVAGGKRLYDVLALAGGIPPTASHTVVINRPGITDPIVIDLGTDPARSSYANVPVFPRDTIVVSRVGVVYLLGAFKNQTAFPIQQNAPFTLMQLAALGGGPNFEGSYGDMRLIRSTGGTRTVVRVDIKKVINGQAPDPVLQADDIVFLPTSNMKGAIKFGGIGTLLGLASILIVAFHP